MNTYKILSRGIAFVVGIDMFVVGANISMTAKSNEISSVESTSSIELPELQSDMEFVSSELLFNDDPPASKYYDDGIMEVEGLSREGGVRGPLAEKVATDWVEPTPSPEPPKSIEFTYQARSYSEEEIANNALTPYKVPQDTSVMTYYFDNMYDAVATPYCSQFANDNDLYYMAKIIHAEICTLGDEARRCVGTVIINRAWNDDHPNTIYGVITESGQFDTAFTRKEPCEKCLAAAYDILYNGYRSFPHYVDSFQCICDNYFYGHNTYVAFNDGHYKTWFSYKARKKIIISLE